MNFFEYMIAILPEMGNGILTTLVFTFSAMGIGFVLSVPMCVLSLYGNKVVKGIILVYVQMIRGTPLLVQLYIIYFGLPKLLLPMGITMSSYVAAMIGFILNSTAYQIEYMKGGFKAISSEQFEAGLSIGMSKWKTIITVIVPQGLRFAIPSLSNELIYLLKYTSLGFVIQAPELMAKAKILASKYARYMETYIIAAFIYILLTFILTKLADILEKRVRIPGFTPEKIR